MRKILRTMAIVAMLMVSTIKSTIFAVLEVPMSLIVILYYYNHEEMYDEMSYWRYSGLVFQQLYITYRDLIVEVING